MLKILKEECIPVKATKFSAAIDLKAAEDVIIKSKEVKKIPLGIKLDLEKINGKEIQEYGYLQLSIRSSLAKKGLLLANGVGIIDMDYPDEICALIYNSTKKDIEIKKGDRVVQLILLQHLTEIFEIESKEDRKGGFGSTGK